MTGPYKAEYRCVACKQRFDVMQGPGSDPHVHPSCPKCGHLWVEWLNYRTLYRDRFSSIKLL